MKKLLLLIALLTSLSGLGYSQSVTGSAKRVITGGTLPATCAVGDVYYKTGSSAGMKVCSATNTWTSVAGSGGSVSGLTAGRVTVAASSTALTDYAGFTHDGTTLTAVDFKSTAGNGYGINGSAGNVQGLSYSGTSLVLRGGSHYIQSLSGGSTLMYVDDNGVYVNAATDATTQFKVIPSANTKIGQIIKLAASQSADALQVQNSSAVVLAKITAAGRFTGDSFGFTGFGSFMTEEATRLLYYAVGQKFDIIDLTGTKYVVSFNGSTGIHGFGRSDGTQVVQIDATTSRIGGFTNTAYIDLYNASTGNLNLVNTSSTAAFGKVRFYTQTTERGGWDINGNFYFGAGTYDIALNRNAAGVLEINNGTAGTYRDLILRSETISRAGEQLLVLNNSSSVNVPNITIGIGSGSQHSDGYFFFDAASTPTVANQMFVFTYGATSSGFSIGKAGDTVSTIQAWSTAIPFSVLDNIAAATAANGIAIGGMQQGASTITSGTRRNVYFSSAGFAPTSGSGVFNQVEVATTINQTGGASGITRGIYINPTLTAAADWRGLDVMASYVATSGTLTNANIRTDVNAASSSSATVSALTLDQRTQGSQNYTSSTGFMGVNSTFTGYGTGTLTWARSFRSYIDAFNSVVTNAAGLYVSSIAASGAGSVGTKYGIYLESQSGGTSGSYSIYSAGGPSYFTGNVAIASQAYITNIPLSVLKTNAGSYVAYFANTSGTSSQSFGLLVDAGTNGSDFAFRVRNNSGGANLYGIDGYGAVTVTLNSSASVGLTLKGAASQSANLQEWQNSSGTVVSSVGPNGDILIYTGGSIGGLTISNTQDDQYVNFVNSGVSRWKIRQNNASLKFTSQSTGVGGVGKDFIFTGGTLGSGDSSLFSLIGTFNDSGTIFTGIKSNITNTASATGTKLLDLQIAGTSMFAVTKAGYFGSIGSGGATAWGVGTIGSDQSYNIRSGFLGSGDSVKVVSNGVNNFGFSGSAFRAGAAMVVGFVSNTDAFDNALDAAFSRISAGLIGVGTGAAGSVAGSMSMTNLTLAGNFFAGPSTIESFTTNASALGTLNYYTDSQTIYYDTAAATADVTLNVDASASVDLNTRLATGQMVTVVLALTNTGTAYKCNTLQVHSVGQTIKWVGGAAPTGNINAVDFYTFTIMKTGASTYYVTGSQTSYK